MTSQLEHNYFIGPTSFGSIISRGWWLYRSHFWFFARLSVYVVLIFLILSINTTSQEIKTYNILPWQLTKNLDTVLIACIFLPTLFNVVYIKAFNDILFNKKPEFKEIISFLKQKFVLVLKFSLFFLFISVVFIIIDLILFLAIGSLLFIIADFLYQPLAFSAVGLVIFYTGFMFLLALHLAFCLLIISLQLFLILNQLICILIEETSIKLSIIRTFEIAFYNFSRAVIFGLSLVAISLCIFFLTDILFSITSYSLINLVSSLFKTHIYQRYLYFIINQLVFFITAGVLWPFIISSLLMFYYDTKMRLEGLDIFYRLRNLRNEYVTTI